MAETIDALSWSERAPILAKALKDKGLSGAEVARRLNYDPSHVSRWLRGGRVPDAEQLESMLRLADYSADELLGITSSALRRRAEEAQRMIDRLTDALALIERSRPAQ
jgi:transcriptional regulator with XRE-family HTH domain